MVRQLIVRNLDDALVRALKLRAARHGRSMEAEHREILRAGLASEMQRASFKDWLGSMPDIGGDDDFLARRDYPRDVD